MEFSERKLWRKNMRIALVMLLLAVAGVCASRFYFNPKYELLKNQLDQTSVIAQRISTTNEEAARLEKQLGESGKQYESILENKDSYIAFLGTLAQKHSLDINKMTVDDIYPEGGLLSLNAEIELQGELFHIKNFVQDLYEADKVIRILSTSYRVQVDSGANTLKWMWRSIDDTQLVPWWDVQQENTIIFATPEDLPEPLSADDLMKHGSALCYLDVEFLGTGGD